jgi:hypothetical protein
MVPVVACIIMVNPSYLNSAEIQFQLMDASAKALFTEVTRLHDRITLANHPILMPILELEILLLIPLAILVNSLIRGRVPLNGGRDAVMNLIEAKAIARAS